jgi:DNA-nicking Smr family endonuclease
MPNRSADPPHRPHDIAVWREATKGVAPLRTRAAVAEAADTRALTNEPSAPADSGRKRFAVAPADRLAGIDRATAERLKRGQVAIEARLDLHGMTQSEAHRALAVFVRESAAAGRRCVLVVTGRGLGPDGPGILKRSVPRWLDEPELRRPILVVAAARPRHGGAGALYVLLRRRR